MSIVSGVNRSDYFLVDGLAMAWFTSNIKDTPPDFVLMYNIYIYHCQNQPTFMQNPRMARWTPSLHKKSSLYKHVHTEQKVAGCMSSTCKTGSRSMLIHPFQSVYVSPENETLCNIVSFYSDNFNTPQVNHI